MKKQKKSKKFFVAFLLGILALSGLAINVSALDDTRQEGTAYGVFKDIKNNPFEFVEAEGLFIPSNFDYIKQMNNEFAGDFYSDKKISSFAGDSLKELKKSAEKKK